MGFVLSALLLLWAPVGSTAVPFGYDPTAARGSTVATEQSEKSARESLRGVDGLTVLVEITPGIADGLKTQLKTDIELRLRQNRITVLSDEESKTAAAKGVFYLLYVNVAASEPVGAPSDPWYGLRALNLEVSLTQWIEVVRTREPILSPMLSPTWNRGVVFVAMPQNIVTKSRDTARDLVDAFVNDYLAVNRQ